VPAWLAWQLPVQPRWLDLQDDYGPEVLPRGSEKPLVMENEF
jgi:hypothetical protein